VRLKRAAAVLAALGFATLGTTAPQSSATATHPATGPSVQRFWLGITTTDAFNYRQAPRYADFIAHWFGSWKTQGARFKRYHPGGRVLVYANLGTTGDNRCCFATAINLADARANGWLARHNGAEIPNPWNPSAKNRVLDLGRPGVAAAITASLEAKGAGQGWDGIFADDVNAWFNLWAHGEAIDGYNSPQDYWGRAVIPTLQYVASHLRADKRWGVVPNVGDWSGHPEHDDAAAVGSGAMNEYFLVDGNGRSQAPAIVENEYRSVQNLAAAGRTYYGVVQRTDARGVRFAFCAAAIMGGDHPELVRIATQKAYGSKAPVRALTFRIRLGAPIGPVTHAAGSRSWRRAFAGGHTLRIDTQAQTCRGL
jgi:hypothetical protein